MKWGYFHPRVPPPPIFKKEKKRREENKSKRRKEKKKIISVICFRGEGRTIDKIGILFIGRTFHAQDIWCIRHFNNKTYIEHLFHSQNIPWIFYMQCIWFHCKYDIPSDISIKDLDVLIIYIVLISVNPNTRNQDISWTRRFVQMRHFMNINVIKRPL